jgi:hypothetical protein
VPRITVGALGVAVDVHVEGSGEIFDALHRLLVDLEGTAPPNPPRGRITVEKVADGYCVTSQGRTTAPIQGWAAVADAVQRRLNRLVIYGSDHLVLHSAGVTSNGIGVLLPAASRSGKSTLAAALVRAGFDYLSDEAVGVGRSSVRLKPYPKPISLRPGSWGLFPGLIEHTSSESSGRESPALVPASSIRPDAVGGACQPSVIVLPSYAPDAQANLEALHRAEALMELTTHTVRFDEQPREALDLLADVVRRCECYRLTYSSLEEAVKCTHGVMETPA